MSLFKFRWEQNVAFIACPTQMDSKAAAEFESQSPEWLKQPILLFILDFQQVKDLDNSMYRAIGQFHRALRKQNRFLSTINASKAIIENVFRNGLDTVFCLQTNLQEALQLAGKSTPGFLQDPRFVESFAKAGIQAVEIQGHTHVTAGKAFTKTNSDLFDVDLATVAALTCDGFKGSVALCFPIPVILGIYSSMVGEEHKTLNEEVEDGAAELLNIVVGQARAELDPTYPFNTIVATVVRGSQLQVRHPGRGPVIVLPFETGLGSFHIEISGKETH